MPKISIAIDGTAGTGKSTVAKLLAKRFGLSYVDTGAMYRGIGLIAKRKGIASDDEQALEKEASSAVFRFAIIPETLVNRVFLNDEEITEEIREPEISAIASRVSALSTVRRELVALQKRMGENGGVVMEGRDICGVVLPKAEVKIFLSATLEVRAKRRFIELKAAGKEVSFETVLSDMEERDHRDTTREDSPLRPVEDASIIDTDNLNIEQVVEVISKIAEQVIAEYA